MKITEFSKTISPAGYITLKKLSGYDISGYDKQYRKTFISYVEQKFNNFSNLCWVLMSEKMEQKKQKKNCKTPCIGLRVRSRFNYI